MLFIALLSSGCRATVEGLPNVQSSSTTQQWQSRVGRIQSIFISGQLNVIPLFRYSVILYSVFYSVPELTLCSVRWDRVKFNVEIVVWFLSTLEGH